MAWQWEILQYLVIATPPIFPDLNARDLIKIESGHVTVLGPKNIRIATRNSGVRASTKKLDISPSLYSEVPSP